jgi:hypothetical protein
MAPADYCTGVILTVGPLSRSQSSHGRKLELPLSSSRRNSNPKPIYRACNILRFVHGMSREEIAAQTGLTELRAKGHLQYALKLLGETIMSKCLPFASPGEVSADV